MDKHKGPVYSRWAVLALFLLIAPLSFGQPTRPCHRIGLTSRAFRSIVARAKPAREYARLIEKLREQGVKAKRTNERVQQPFFFVAGRVITVNDEALQVFEYVSNSAADNEAKRVSADGMTVGRSKPSWMATPHFFKRGKLIVIYVGENEAILKSLKATLGDQFAGS